MESFYNIHNLIKIKVDNQRNDLQEGYRHYLRYFKVNQTLLDVQYEIKEFSDLQLPADSFRAGGFLRFEGGVCFDSEKYAVTYDGTKITEYATYANRATNFWIQNLLLKNNASFVHAAAAEVNGKGFIFPAFGGVGKTTLISHLRNLDGFKFFGDDFVIVTKQGEMLSYPSDFSIYDYHVKLFPEIKKMAYGNFLLKRKYFSMYYFIKKAINFAAKRLRIWSGPLLTGWNAVYAKVPATDLISLEKIGQSTVLRASIFLEKYSGTTIQVKPMSQEELLKMVTSILGVEFQYGTPYFNALATTTDFDSVAFYQTQKEILIGTFSNIQCYKLMLPEKVKANDYFNYVDNFLRSL